MSATRFNNLLQPVKRGDRLADVLSPDRLNALSTLAQEGASGLFMSGGPGMYVTRGPHGVSVRARRVRRRAGGSTEKPWQLRSDGSIVPGTIGGVVPRIDSTPISGGSSIPTLTIPESYNGYLVAELTFSLSWNGDYLSDPITLNTVKFNLATTVPANSVSTGKFYRAFGSLNDGLPSAPFFSKASLNWTLCGNAANAATLTLTEA